VKTKKTDRRSQRTQRLVGNALVTLLLEKRYDHITIQDILSRADVGRATFYEHYFDKEDVLTSEIERVVDLLNQQVAVSRQEVPVFLPSLGIFEHVYEHYPLYQALLPGKGLSTATQALQNYTRMQVAHGLRGTNDVSDDMIAATASSVAGAFIALLQWWLETELVWSPERIDALFRALVLPGVQHLLQQESERGESVDRG